MFQIENGEIVTARRHVIVILSVRPSVTLVDCGHMVRPTIMISTPYGSPIIVVFADITIISKFEGGHRPLSCRISVTVQDTTTRGRVRAGPSF